MEVCYFIILQFLRCDVCPNSLWIIDSFSLYGFATSFMEWVDLLVSARSGGVCSSIFYIDINNTTMSVFVSPSPLSLLHGWSPNFIGINISVLQFCLWHLSLLPTSIPVSLAESTLFSKCLPCWIIYLYAASGYLDASFSEGTAVLLMHCPLLPISPTSERWQTESTCLVLIQWQTGLELNTLRSEASPPNR